MKKIKLVEIVTLIIITLITFSGITTSVYAKEHKHKWETAEVIVEATCTKEGQIRRVCTVEGCDATEIKTVKKIGHVYIPATCQKKATCMYCGKTKGNFGDHIYGEVKVIKEATCTEGGEQELICTVDGCGATKIKKTKKLGHSYTKATCQKKATCIRCGKTKGKLAKHVAGETKVVKEATCTEKGLKATKCKTCDLVAYKETKKLGHNYKLLGTKVEKKKNKKIITGYFMCTRCEDKKTKTVTKK